jgi:MFS superfamily sulfate permease-like transporter
LIGVRLITFEANSVAIQSEQKTVPAIAQTFLGNLRFDALAGFFVFLIAMPLCLAIARASGFPPIAGIWTAVIGGVLTTFLSNAQLTIKGPAAGLIVIVAGAVKELGQEFGPDLSEVDQAILGYQLSLGIGVASGIIQILLGLVRAGRLADFFPLTPVHGMLASIGIIIIAKQSYEVLGLTPAKGAGPLELLAELPGKVIDLNPVIALIGVIGFGILLALPLIASRFPLLKKIPGPLLVLAVAISLGLYFDLDHQHSYKVDMSMSHPDTPNTYTVGPQHLVTIPNVLENPKSAFMLPDFRGLATKTGMTYLLLFVIIGSLESLLSAKAIELIDPWKRKTNFDRDLTAIGIANLVSAAVGGLPIISEIVRSKANIDSGARTKYANAFHGLFLLGFVLLFPGLIHSIPLAALGAMLVYTGFRLASPYEFARTWKVGVDQFVVFTGTIIATLATDLLIGIAVGIFLKVCFHLWNGAPIGSLVVSDICSSTVDDKSTIIVKKAAVFTNWLRLRKVIMDQYGSSLIVVDLSETKLVDHSVMEKLHELEAEFALQGKHLSVKMSEQHQPLGSHPQSAQQKRAST